MQRTSMIKTPSKVCILLVLCLCACSIISAAIVLETTSTEMKIVVKDRVEERSKLPSSSVRLPLCSIIITAKHAGTGYITIFNTPLSGGGRQVMYSLIEDTRGSRLPSILSYRGNPSIPLTIPLANITAQLDRALQGDRSSYSSDLFVHLSFEM